jgi:hypothetical protein
LAWLFVLETRLCFRKTLPLWFWRLQAIYNRNYEDIQANYTQWSNHKDDHSMLIQIIAYEFEAYTPDSGQKNCTVIGTPTLSSA